MQLICWHLGARAKAKDIVKSTKWNGEYKLWKVTADGGKVQHLQWNIQTGIRNVDGVVLRGFVKVSNHKSFAVFPDEAVLENLYLEFFFFFLSVLSCTSQLDRVCYSSWIRAPEEISLDHFAAASIFTDYSGTIYQTAIFCCPRSPCPWVSEICWVHYVFKNGLPKRKMSLVSWTVGVMQEHSTGLALKMSYSSWMHQEKFVCSAHKRFVVIPHSVGALFNELLNYCPV